MGICLVYGSVDCLLFYAPRVDSNTGAAVGAMGYPTPLPPANASEEEQLQFNPPSTELISKVGPPLASFLGYVDWTAFSAAVRFPAFYGNLLRIGENEYCLFL